MLFTQSSQVVANRLERRTLDGRLYAVAPATIVVAGVLNGALLPVDELRLFVDAWNGRPVPLRHPRRNGEFVSASRMDVIEKNVFGQVLNCSFEEDRLRGELWIDVVKAEFLGGDALRTLVRMDRGEVVELSSGYFCDTEEAVGEFNGVPYNGIHRNLRPDHVALLPDQVGACSIADGCGAPRVNRAQGDGAPQDGVMIAFFVPMVPAMQLALDGTQLPEGCEVLPYGELHVTLAYLGKVDEVAPVVDEASLLRNLADFARQETLVHAEIGGIGRFCSNDGMEAIWLAINSSALMDFRQRLLWGLGWEAKRERGFTPHITLAYVPASEDVILRTPIRTTLAFERVSLAWGGRVSEFSLQGESSLGESIEPVRPVVVANSSCKESVMNEAEKKDAKVALVKPGDATEVDVSGLIGNAQFVTQVATQVATILGEAQRRSSLIDGLTANAVAFTEAELTAMPIETLDKLAKSLRPVATGDFAGRGGVRTNVASSGTEWIGYEDAVKQQNAAKK